MADIQNLKDDFAREMIACKDLYNYCLSSRGLHTNAGIEGAFLQMQTKWEAFLEEVFLAFLVGQQPLSGDKVKPHFTVIDIDVARIILYQGQQYADWAKFDVVIKRLGIYFDLGLPNRFVNALKAEKLNLEEIADIRNFIAHSSIKAKKNSK